MALEAKENDSRWTVSRTAMNKDDVDAFFEGAIHLKKVSKENNSDETPGLKKNQTNRWIDPSSGNILHSSRKMLHSPALRRLQPSQIKSPSEARDETSIAVSRLAHINAVVQSANKVPTGRQLPRSPVVAKNHDQKALLVHKDDTVHGENSLRQHLVAEQVKAVEDSGQECKETLGTCSSIETSRLLHHRSSSSSLPLLSLRSKFAKDVMEPVSATMNLEDLSEGHESLEFSSVAKGSTSTTRKAKSSKKMRLSQVPIRRTSQIRVSGVLRRLPGCQLLSQDLEFLMQMEHKRKAKTLKKELLNLRNEVMKVHWQKEAILAVQENIKKDIQLMKGSYDEVIKLGRFFLSRHHPGESVETLRDEDVLSQLNTQTVLNVLHQQKAELERMTQKMKTRKKHDAPISVQRMEENISKKLDACNKQVQLAECSVQREQGNVDNLKIRVEKLQQEVISAEENLTKAQSEIHCLKSSKESTAASKPRDEFQERRLHRKLERILRRIEIFLERERIIKRLRKTLG